ncbi:YybS family protein [Bacillus sp. JJ1764]|uniref:YybS family protein n=1 Tax=Bacillus sp. JJ1764 TaxID=3122964 RepID=UPI00300032E5
MKNARKLTEGAMLLAIFAVLLLITIYIPLLGMIVNFFIAIPFIMFAAKNDWKWSAVFVVASILISLIVGSVQALPIALPFATTGAVMGFLIQRKKSRITISVASTLVFLVNIIGIYAVTVVFFHMDIIQESIKALQESINMSAEMLKKLGQGAQADKTIEQFNHALSLLNTLVPTLFVIGSLFFVLIIQLVSFPIIKRFGIQVGMWSSLKDVKLPKSILWYLLITLAASIILNPHQGTFLYAALINLTYILQFLMIFQGYTLLFFFFDLKGMSKGVSITLAILAFIVPIFLYIIGILGIIDLGFDLRKRFEKKE